MTKSLVIVESPAKAPTISKFLGPDYIVKSSFGHLLDLSTEGAKNLGVNIDNNFEPKYTVIPRQKDKIKAIRAAASQCDKILIASDNDREGEAIAFHLASILKDYQKPISRIVFNEITKKAILKGIAEPRELDENLYNAQQARRILDRIVGFCVSPFLIRKLGPKLSAGRVQSVAVRMIVDREREIESFQPEEYWTITSDLAKINGQDHFTAKYIERVIDEKTATKIKEELEKDSYLIADVLEEEKQKPPFPPFITSSLLAASAGKYKMSSGRAMKAAQSLYEAGKITYIRTDSTRISTDAIEDCREWLLENAYDIPSKPNFYSKKGAQDAHEAIRPTDVSITVQNIFGSEDEQKIYGLIWERFMACQMKPALYDNVMVTVETSSGHRLKAGGRTLKYKGWLDIMNDLDRSDKDILLPKLTIGEKLALVPPKVVAIQKFTKPPSRFTDKTLVKEFEKRGIGRPGTYATILGKITDRGYVQRKSNAFVATERGKEIVDELVKFFKFLNYDYTAEMEVQLDKVAAGNLSWTKMLRTFYDPFQKELKEAYTSDNKDYGFVCEKCKSKMALKHGSYGFFMACTQYPKCKNAISVDMVNDIPVVRGKNKLEPVSGVFCPNCKSPMVKKAGEWGEFYSCVEYPKCKGTRKVPYGKKCPECNGELYATLYKDNSVLFCMNYPNCTHSEKLDEEIPNPKKLVAKKIPKKIKKYIKE